MYEDIYIRLQKQQRNQGKESKRPFPENELSKGTPVWAYLTGGEPIKAEIILDAGQVVLIKKIEYLGRFKEITVHKSRISKRLPKRVPKLRIEKPLV